MMTAGRTVAFSSATVAGAGLALMVFPLRFLYSMGIGVTLVSFVAALVSLVVLPSLFAVLQHRVNAGAPQRWQRAREAEARADQAGFWYRLSQFVMRFPVAVALAGTAILLTLGAPFLGIKLTGVDATVLPEGSPPSWSTPRCATTSPAPTRPRSSSPSRRQSLRSPAFSRTPWGSPSWTAGPRSPSPSISATASGVSTYSPPSVR